ncbi:Transmembrane protein 69 [Batrachochytrium dendrobatidis]|nr:Transmembrane protein 69 [Batrachochytrium dendrobatidis]KAK5665666.1 Transmembrane protein 69 [Batrachochytrium dendrobatidis]
MNRLFTRCSRLRWASTSLSFGYSLPLSRLLSSSSRISSQIPSQIPPQTPQTPSQIQSKLDQTSIPTPVKLISIASLIPFIGTAAGAVYMPEAVMLISETQAIYGCVVMSFAGAIHWGLAMSSFGAPSTASRYVLSVLPAAWAFATVALVPHIPVRLIFEAAGFAVMLIGDLMAHKKKLCPSWYLGLRFWMSSIAIACLGTNIYIAW